MSLDSLAGPGLALLVSLGWAALFAGLRRPGLAALALPLGFAAGAVWVLGSLSASPRQLPERLPVLALALAVAVLPVALVARPWLWVATGLATALGGAWWLAGAPLILPDLRRAASLLAALAILLPTLALETRARWPAVAAVVGLAVGLAGAGAFGPWAPLGLVLLAGALPALLLAPGPAAFVALAVLLGALGAGPVVARGGAADWLALAAPLAALLPGQRLGRWGPALAGVPAALAWVV